MNRVAMSMLKQQSFSLALLGRAEGGRFILRQGARPGDLIYCSGTLGDSALGLRLLREGVRDSYLVMRHLSPTPRLQLGRELAQRELATAMIDISDGLAQDLSHLLGEGLGAEVYLERLPLSPAYREEAGRLSPDPYRWAVSGGEDYELLFTSPREREGEVRALSQELSLPLTPIGEIKEGGGMRLITPEGGIYPSPGGYDHLKEGG